LNDPRAKTGLASPANRFGDAIVSLPVAAILTTPAREITAANTAASNLFGYPTAELIGLSARSLYASADDWTASETHLNGAPTQTLTAPLAATVRHRSGTLADVSVTILSIDDAAGSRTGILELMTPLDDQAADSTQAITNTDTSILRLARGAAHDFKNLLAIIAGNLQLARDGARPKDMRVFLQDAEHASDMAARLADQMIGFAQARPYAAIALDVASELKLQKPILQHAAGPEITLNFEIAADCPKIMADRSGFENAILNLVLNARDASPAGGTVTIAASNAIGLLPLIASEGIDRAKSAVAISVTDTGAGMTKRVRARAFDPFFSTKSMSRGTGLGLATVLGFACQSGGTADITSTLGSGTTVTLYLPAIDA